MLYQSEKAPNQSAYPPQYLKRAELYVVYELNCESCVLHERNIVHLWLRITVPTWGSATLNCIFSYSFPK